MFRIIVVTLYYGVSLAFTETSIMMFNVDSNNICTLQYRPVILEKEPLKIFVNNTRDINNGLCQDASRYKIDFSYTEMSNVFMAEINQVSINHGNKWKCWFYPSYWFRQTNAYCVAEFHLRTKNPIASITLNNNLVNATPTNLSITNYDAEAQYFFEEYETVIIYCSTSQTKVLLEYLNSAGESLIESSNTFILKLGQEDHSNYAECMSSDKDNDISVTRLVFYMLSEGATKSIIMLRINGMYVRPVNTIYNYVYYPWERTDIICELRNDNNLVINLDQNSYSSVGQFQVNKTIYLNNNDHSDVVCTAKRNNSDVIIESVTVKFIRDVNDFYISGFNKGKILKHYKETEYSSVIYYEFKDSEILTLNCTKTDDSGPKQLKWTYNNITIQSTGKTKASVITQNLVITLQVSDANSNLTCTYYPKSPSSNHRQIVIRLIYHVGMPSDNGNSNDDNDFKVLEFIKSHWLWLIVCFGAIMLIIIIMALIVNSFRGKRNKKQSSDMNCGMSPKSENSPLPHPSQWSESNYTELRESDDDEPNYENRLKFNKKTKKKLQNNNSNNDSEGYYANVEQTKCPEPALNYADISVGNNTKMLVKTDPVAYSRITFSESSMEGSNYVNVGNIEGASYVNSSVGEEQTEPAYCEVNQIPRQ